MDPGPSETRDIKVKRGLCVSLSSLLFWSLFLVHAPLSSPCDSEQCAARACAALSLFSLSLDCCAVGPGCLDARLSPHRFARGTLEETSAALLVLLKPAALGSFASPFACCASFVLTPLSLSRSLTSPPLLPSPSLPTTPHPPKGLLPPAPSPGRRAPRAAQLLPPLRHGARVYRSQPQEAQDHRL